MHKVVSCPLYLKDADIIQSLFMIYRDPVTLALPADPLQGSCGHLLEARIAKELAHCPCCRQDVVWSTPPVAVTQTLSLLSSIALPEFLITPDPTIQYVALSEKLQKFVDQFDELLQCKEKPYQEFIGNCMAISDQFRACPQFLAFGANEACLRKDWTTLLVFSNRLKCFDFPEETRQEVLVYETIAKQNLDIEQTLNVFS